MNQTDQKRAFLDSEGNRFYERNRTALQSADEATTDEVITGIRTLNLQPRTILEIGCSNGWRLEALRKTYGARCYGIEPSVDAIREGQSQFQHLSLQQGTADSLPFDASNFDLVVFGFCLYLCDRKDLFKIASEADRVLKEQGHIAILDFFPPFPYRNDYKHLSGMSSYKMNYANLFSWNPAYTLLSQRTFPHGENSNPGNPDERLSVAILYKDTQHAYPENPFKK